MSKTRRCGNCGSRNTKRVDFINTPIPWKDYPSVFLSKSIALLRCQECDESVLSAHDTQSLDQAIQESIVEQVRCFIKTILSREDCLQGELAKHLGVSQEYLSEIKSGRKLPSFQVFNFLKTLASNRESFAVSNPSYRVSRVSSE